MAYESEIELETARIIVRRAAGGPVGLFLVRGNGALEGVDDRPSFGRNPVAVDLVWSPPPALAIEDARRIAEQKG